MNDFSEISTKFIVLSHFSIYSFDFQPPWFFHPDKDHIHSHICKTQADKGLDLVIYLEQRNQNVHCS